MNLKNGKLAGILLIKPQLQRKFIRQPKAKQIHIGNKTFDVRVTGKVLKAQIHEQTFRYGI